MLFYVFAQLLFSSLDPCVICIGLLLCSTTELLLYNYTALGVALQALMHLTHVLWEQAAYRYLDLLHSQTEPLQ